MTPQSINCSTCKYWEKIQENAWSSLGYCHRSPPPRVEKPQRTLPEQCPMPTTRDKEWCGEYEKLN